MNVKDRHMPLIVRFEHLKIFGKTMGYVLFNIIEFHKGFLMALSPDMRWILSGTFMLH